MSKALVLLSGGLDSAVCLYWAKANYDRVRCLTFFYGQRHLKEVFAAEAISEMAKVPRDDTGLSALRLAADSQLTGGIRRSKDDLPQAFVPCRNAVFLVTAGAFAAKHGCDAIVIGSCAADAAGFPDCRREFLDAQEQALRLAAPELSTLRIEAPLLELSKAETIRLGVKLGAWLAIKETLSCYNGERPGCGKCLACEHRRQGFLEAGYADPAAAGGDQ